VPTRSGLSIRSATRVFRDDFARPHKVETYHQVNTPRPTGCGVRREDVTHYGTTACDRRARRPACPPPRAVAAGGGGRDDPTGGGGRRPLGARPAARSRGPARSKRRLFIRQFARVVTQGRKIVHATRDPCRSRRNVSAGGKSAASRGIADERSPIAHACATEGKNSPATQELYLQTFGKWIR
jgi:hypothetical protein